MVHASKETIRQLIMEWREVKAAQWGLTESHEHYCARNSLILHDIFVDAIAENAKDIHSVNDLQKYAFYWKWIDAYGQELFNVLKEYLDRPKRSLGDDDFEHAPRQFTSSPKRVRTEV